ncbi:MAG: penicillin-binding protein 2 [Dehalococcoidia bacterium]|nr:penicillin-binding protein 2 [Dehalococcoidia bacterium]
MRLFRQQQRRWRSPKSEPLSDAERLRDKFFYFRLLVLTAFAVLTLQLLRLQVFEGEAYQQRAENNRLRVVPVMPSRGLIFDRNGVPLVENVPRFSVGVVPADLPEEKEEPVLQWLEKLLGVSPADVSKDLEERRSSNDPYTPLIVKSGIEPEKAFAVREAEAELAGVRLVVEPVRRYGGQPVLSHILGYVGQVADYEYEELKSKGYGMNDRVGKSGVELQYEEVLRGTPGYRQVEVDASGREISTLDSSPAVPGNSLVLSIDLDLQQKTAEILQAAMGDSLNAVAAVMDVHTGELLALVSLPGFDDNMFTDITEEQFRALLDDPRKPLVNHAISEVYPPGSTFKQITASAALQEGVANAGTTITSHGSITVPNEYDPSILYVFRDWSALGTLNFYGGVAMSSDVYFYYLGGGYYENGVELFRGLGAERLAEYCRRFGLGRPTGVDLPGEAEGNVPDPEWKERELGEGWFIGDTYNFSIGQGYVTTTPLQMLQVTAAVANGGHVMLPRVVREIIDPAGNTVVPFVPRVTGETGVSDENLSVLREGMRQAVSWGTATTAAASSVSVAGKTGTAEFGPDLGGGHYATHGWFTGFAPANDPQVAVVVFLEKGNGAKNAAPIGGQILNYFFSRKSAG